MKQYKINVNGTFYEVTIEEVDASEIKSAAPAPAQAPAAPAAAAPASGEKVNAPMPGNILAVNVNVGDVVKAGQVGMILEAMKMENEIMIPCDGTVTAVGVTKGATVESGAFLFSIG
ncbi:MAG: acetyl-CoA carboxylase biotin carboxyl carrier protein subunit [Clostridia bacterium]|nr:acetyl-CoA carboxylase biotin carboxyl carrier protein subunit [Clostridia bacterium]